MFPCEQHQAQQRPLSRDVWSPFEDMKDDMKDMQRSGG